MDDVTTTVIEEIIRLFKTLQEDHAEMTLGESTFWYYWRKFREKTSLSISGAHTGHYKSATFLDIVMNFLFRKIMLIARGGCPPERWGYGLQVLLEKVAGVALVNKLRAILLMEADFNYMYRWVFGYQAINKMYALGYIPGDQYSQKESTAEDARMDNQLTMDISRQLRHPLATMSANADKCYDRINHIIMSLLLLAIIGSMGPVIAMLHPIQMMKFFQRTARGDSTTFMGGRGRDNPLQGLCQGNSAALACWLIISLLLMHGYRRKGFRSRILSPISGVIIDFLGKIYVDDTDLSVTCLDLVSAADVQEELRAAASTWAAGLNATGGAINPEKSRWILADYHWANGQWGYAEQHTTPMGILLPDGSTANIVHGDVTTAKKALGVRSTVSGNDNKYLEENATGRVGSWINRMRNGHLPTRLGWMVYRFKLLPDIRYRLATLAIPLTAAQRVLL